MEVIFKDKNGNKHKFTTNVVEVIGKDNDRYRIHQDSERGIEVTTDGFSGKLYVEPRCSNQVTLISKEDL